MTPGGQTLFGCVFDPNDLDAAFEELDVRYFAGEGAIHVDTLKPFRDVLSAYNREDWQACRALLADDFVVVDHRPAPALYGAIHGPDEFIATLPMFELASGVRARALAVSLGRQGSAVAEMRTTATTAEGADIELAFHLAFTVRSAKITRLEFYAVDQLEAALAAFLIDEGPSNAASRGWDRVLALFKAGDWDAFAAAISDEAVGEDRRSLVGGSRWETKDAMVAVWQGIAAIGATEIVSETIATRGERSALARVVFTGDSGEVEALFVHRLDERGLYAGGASFDPGDVGPGFAYLDALYAADLSPEHTEVWRLSTALTDLYNARDFASLRDIFAEDAVIVDKRVTDWGTLDRETFIEHLGELVGMATDAFLACVTVYELTATGSAGRFRVTGTVPDGGDFEIPFECVSTVRDGRLTRLELLSPAQLA
jgi:ketosteroid isomerase-like protein